jgi:hypothetical protein
VALDKQLKIKSHTSTIRRGQLNAMVSSSYVKLTSLERTREQKVIARRFRAEHGRMGIFGMQSASEDTLFEDSV